MVDMKQDIGLNLIEAEYIQWIDAIISMLEETIYFIQIIHLCPKLRYMRTKIAFTDMV